MASVFGEDAFANNFAKDFAKTYSTISANGIVGVYADRASFCETFAVCDCEFENMIDIMQSCKCISVQKVFLIEQETILYQPYVSREALLLIQFAKLLYLRSTDGNV